MRILVFFDLPVKTKPQRTAATRFRNFLLNDGFYMLQFSVYARICNGQDSVVTHQARIRRALPPRGSVRVLTITEKQYDRIEIMLGGPEPPEERQQCEQLMLF